MTKELYNWLMAATLFHPERMVNYQAASTEVTPEGVSCEWLDDGKGLPYTLGWNRDRMNVNVNVRRPCKVHIPGGLEIETFAFRSYTVVRGGVPVGDVPSLFSGDMPVVPMVEERDSDALLASYCSWVAAEYADTILKKVLAAKAPPKEPVDEPYKVYGITANGYNPPRTSCGKPAMLIGFGERVNGSQSIPSYNEYLKRKDTSALPWCLFDHYAKKATGDERIVSMEHALFQMKHAIMERGLDVDGFVYQSEIEGFQCEVTLFNRNK